MFLSVCFIRYTVLFNRNFSNFAVIIILIVSGNKLTLAVLFGTGEKAHESIWVLPSRESCQELLLCLPQDIHLHQIGEFVFDTLSKLAWILPITLCSINCKETEISDAEDLCISVRKSCAGSSPATSGTLCPANWRLSGWDGKSRLGLSDEILSWQKLEWWYLQALN